MAFEGLIVYGIIYRSPQGFMNSDLTDEIFQSQTYGLLNITEIINKIKEFLEEDPDSACWR